jgi:SAM-dependent methyltransferase
MNNKLNQDSYLKHNFEFETTSNYEWHISEYKKYDDLGLFKKTGFEDIFKQSSKTTKKYIDIGSGGGYLINRASKYFEKVYAVEPSSSGIEISKAINSVNKNVIYINKKMVDAIADIVVDDPFLITTSAVLSHIDDGHVKNFLEKLSRSAPIGSELFFYEPYDKNIQVPLWHIRSKEWWMENLPGWKIEFKNIKSCGYLNGIYGIFLGAENAKTLNLPENQLAGIKYRRITWLISGYYFRLRYFLANIYHMLKK